MINNTFLALSAIFIQFSRYFSEKNQIISFYNSFHGRTLFDVTVGGQAKYCEGFGPLPGMIEHIDFNDIEALRTLISKEKTCAVILEPIQGEGGVLPADKRTRRPDWSR